MASPRPPHEAAAAWLLTGPVGHLAAGLADAGGLLARLAWARARRLR